MIRFVFVAPDICWPGAECTLKRREALRRWRSGFEAV